ncbi:hypothetical protein F4604DRAFT_1919074 [Suillus subluteus]|nr:hypothetical protein F4604DRAFT_1919074 [Suillus subluteus]
MPDSPPESPTIQPVQVPTPWEDFPDNAYEQDQGSFMPVQLPKTIGEFMPYVGVSFEQWLSIEEYRVRMTTSGNGCQGSNHICIICWIEKLRQKTGDASSATRMESTNVKIVLASPSIAQAVAGVNIITILFTGSVNGMDNSLSRVVLLRWDLSYTLAMMANNVQPSQIGGICSKETNTKTSSSLKICHLCQDPSSSQRKTPWSSSTNLEYIAWRYDAVIVPML